MRNLLDNRTLIVVGSGIILALAGFVYILRQPINPEIQLEFENRDFASQVGEELLELMDELRNLSYDRNIVESFVFQSLEDNRVDIQDQPRGRENPFSSQRLRVVNEE